MAFHLVKNPSWNSGGTSPTKYIFHLDVWVDVVGVREVSGRYVATISVKGSYGATDYKDHTANTRKASDYALVAPGDADAWNYNFTPGQDYYQNTLPVVPNAPTAVAAKVLIEFRGDTWASDPSYPGNRTSLYNRDTGVVMNNYYAQGGRLDYAIDMTFDIDVTNGNVPILAYVSSGWGWVSGAPQYSWLEHEVLVSFFQLDYRPGQRKISGTWESHNRSAGACSRKVGGTWTEMRTNEGGVGTSDPPSIKTSGTWYNQKKIGANG